jgi:hypothetical protein
MLVRNVIQVLLQHVPFLGEALRAFRLAAVQVRLQHSNRALTCEKRHSMD